MARANVIISVTSIFKEPLFIGASATNPCYYVCSCCCTPILQIYHLRLISLTTYNIVSEVSTTVICYRLKYPSLIVIGGCSSIRSFGYSCTICSIRCRKTIIASLVLNNIAAISVYRFKWHILTIVHLYHALRVILPHIISCSCRQKHWISIYWSIRIIIYRSVNRSNFICLWICLSLTTSKKSCYLCPLRHYSLRILPFIN